MKSARFQVPWPCGKKRRFLGIWTDRKIRWQKIVDSSINPIVVVQVKWWCYIWLLNRKLQSSFIRHDWGAGCDIPILPIELRHTKINFKVGYDKKKNKTYLQNLKTVNRAALAAILRKKWIKYCSENLNYRENVHSRSGKGLSGKWCL